MEGFQDYLKNSLLRLFPNSKVDGAQNNILINCPLCIKEGRPDTNHHMSISLGNNGKPLLFNCFRNTSHRGLLTGDNLVKLTWQTPSLVEPGLLEAIDNYNKHYRNVSRYNLSKENRFSFEIVRDPTNDYNNELKRSYINNRLGLDLSFEELEKDKVIFSLKDFLIKNYIHQVTRDIQIIDDIDKYFVGFLTNTNGTIILRNLFKDEIQMSPSINQRYIKYSVVQGSPGGYYVIPTSCNIIQQLQIHIGEGTFDILSVFYNLRNANRINNIYACIGGNSYENIIQYFLCTMGIIDPIIHIYIDNDIKPFVLPQIKKIISPLNIDIYIHMNIYPKEKDFGVPKNRINEYIYKL